ncbi:MAG: hypothetical protein ACI8W8_001783, partial [Rhodothermales bacterium]
KLVYSSHRFSGFGWQYRLPKNRLQGVLKEQI